VVPGKVRFKRMRPSLTRAPRRSAIIVYGSSPVTVPVSALHARIIYPPIEFELLFALMYSLAFTAERGAEFPEIGAYKEIIFQPQFCVLGFVL
jgi:hypothetical protein